MSFIEGSSNGNEQTIQGYICHGPSHTPQQYSAVDIATFIQVRGPFTTGWAEIWGLDLERT